jgi:hypothetical protein
LINHFILFMYENLYKTNLLDLESTKENLEAGKSVGDLGVARPFHAVHPCTTAFAAVARCRGRGSRDATRTQIDLDLTRESPGWARPIMDASQAAAPARPPSVHPIRRPPPAASAPAHTASLSQIISPGWLSGSLCPAAAGRSSPTTALGLFVLLAAAKQQLQPVSAARPRAGSREGGSGPGGGGGGGGGGMSLFGLGR